MSRIGASLSGIERSLLNRLAEANAAVTLSALRVASGHKINHPSDNPSAFFALSNFQSESNTVTHTLANVTDASQMVGQAQLALDEVRVQLDTIRDLALADEDQALTPTQRAANQTAIDAAVTEINRLAGTDIGGRRVLDGSANFDFSGINSAQVFNLDVSATGGATRTVSGTVSAAANQAQLTHTEGTGLVAADATFLLSGDRGEVSLSVTTGETLATVAQRVNQESHRTGVTASVAGNDLRFTSIDYGSDAAVRIETTSGTFVITGGDADGTAHGTDAVATINGQAVTGNGNRFSINDNAFRFTVEFQGGFSGAFDTITVSGDALTFALSTDVKQRSTLAVPGVQAVRLGGLSGTLDQLLTGGAHAGLGTNAPTAVRIVDEALGKMDLIEGQVDGFANAAIDSSSNLLTSFTTNLGDAIDSIDKVNTTEESALSLKYQALAANAMVGLSVLDQQRASIVNLLQHIAGLR
ncbi:MAG: flagellin [Pirellulales bacterium]